MKINFLELNQRFNSFFSTDVKLLKKSIRLAFILRNRTLLKLLEMGCRQYKFHFIESDCFF